LFKGAGLFVLPSFEEGFGLPALEAMAAGVPVVTSNRGALPEVVGEAGMLIDPENVEELTAAIERLLGDRAARAALAERGLARARQFSWHRTAIDIRQAYQDARLARSVRFDPEHAHRH
jgi:glycosyltransferase involved in cell wall biosynthesis